MENTSKIKSVSSRFSDKSNKRYYDIVMENWDTGTIWHNNENAYQVWQELKYRLKLKENSTDKYWMNEVKEKKWWYSQKNYNAEFAMKALECAVDFAPQWQDLKGIIVCADTMLDWLQKRSLSANQQN